MMRMNFFMQDEVTKTVVYHGMSSDGELFRIPTKLISNFAVKSTKSIALLGQKVKNEV